MSQTGRIASAALTDGDPSAGGSSYGARYSFDAVGRLVEATLSLDGTVDHTLRYGFGDHDPSACASFPGAVPSAGRNGNRQSWSDEHVTDSGTSVVQSLACYDAADRLLGTVVTGAPTGANSVADGLSSAELAYDLRGNTTTFAVQSLEFDAANRHSATVVDAGTAAERRVEYGRDAGGRIVRRTVVEPGTGVVEELRFAHSASADASSVIVDDVGAIAEYSVALPGGVSARFLPGSEQWSYPNLHGDVILTSDGAGVRSDEVARFDPFGQPIDPATGRIGTEGADESVADTADGSVDYAYVGQHRKLYDTAGAAGIVQMGVRVYVPALGRFLSVDPVEGGVDNSYVYPNDPINQFDLTGMYTADSYERVLRSRGNPSDVGGKVWKSAQPKPNLLSILRSPDVRTPVTTTRPPNPSRGPSYGGVAAKVSLDICVVICGRIGLAGQSEPHLVLGLGVGPEASAGLKLGATGGFSPGVSQSVGCEAAFYGGVYGGGGYSTASKDLAGSVPSGGIWEAGIMAGFGAGCSYMQEWTF